jgi:hypothetical protein
MILKQIDPAFLAMVAAAVVFAAVSVTSLCSEM